MEIRGGKKLKGKNSSWKTEEKKKQKQKKTTHRRGTSCEISQTYVCLNVCHSVAAMTECHWCSPLPLGERRGYTLDKSPARANIYGQTPIHTQGQFKVTHSPVPQIHGFRWWEEAGVPRENPYRQRENTHNRHSCREKPLAPRGIRPRTLRWGNIVINCTTVLPVLLVIFFIFYFCIAVLPKSKHEPLLMFHKKIHPSI